MGIKNLTDGCQASLVDRWDRIICMSTSLKGFFLLARLLVIPQREPCTVKLQCQPNPEQPREGGPPACLCLTYGHSVAPYKKEKENYTCWSKAWTSAKALGVAKSHLSLSFSLYLTHTSLCAAPWPSPSLLCSHLLSEFRTCGALGKSCLVH